MWSISLQMHHSHISRCLYKASPYVCLHVAIFFVVFFCLFLLLFLGLAVLQGLWELSSLTRDQTHVSCGSGIVRGGLYQQHHLGSSSNHCIIREFPAIILQGHRLYWMMDTNPV